MGRMKDRPRYNVISFRAADDEAEEIRSFVKGTGQPKGTLMRELVLTAIRAKAGEGDD